MNEVFRVEVIEESILQCVEPNFCVFCSPIVSLEK